MTETLRLRPAFANWIVADGPHILVGGRSWGPGESEWAWLLGSADGGANWPNDLSWTGGRGSCLGDAAARGIVLVALACAEDRLPDEREPVRTPALWVTSMGNPRGGAAEPTSAPPPTSHEASVVSSDAPAA